MISGGNLSLVIDYWAKKNGNDRKSELNRDNYKDRLQYR